ncbi:MAG: co-chaperone GroES [Planctomycetota bacterium]
MAVASKKKSSKSKKSPNLQPLGDRIVVERVVAESTTSGGILLPGSAQDKPSRGTVISVGDGKLLRDGSRSELQVKPGDHVLFSSYGPDEIKIGEEEYLLMREDDVLAVIE